jgi:serine/threonine protein kinase
MNEAIPTFSGRYRLLGRFGHGGMGVVWRAHDETLNRMVAVKQLVLPPELSAADRRTARERVLREARAKPAAKDRSGTQRARKPKNS